MKKIFALILTGLLLVCTAACSANNSETMSELEELIYEIDSKEEMNEFINAHSTPEEQLIIASSESEMAWEILLVHPEITQDAFMKLTEQPLESYKVAPILPETMQRVALSEEKQIELIKADRLYHEALLRAQLFTTESLTVLCEYWNGANPNQEIQNLFAMAIEINQMTPEQQVRVIDTGNPFLQEELVRQQSVSGDTLVYMAKNYVCDVECIANEVTWASRLTSDQSREIIHLGKEELQMAFLKRSDVSFDELYEIAVTNSFRTNPEARELYKLAFERAELSIEQRERILLIASDILS